jgi:Spy/CpxP family protein refolding chaperone
MKFTSRFALALCASSMLVAVGCAEADVPENAGGEAAAADEAQPESAPVDDRGEHRRGKHFKGKHHGPSLVKMALELDLTDAQRATIEKLKVDFKPSSEARAAHKALNEALAEGVRSGNVDKAGLADEIEAVESQMQANKGTHSENIKALHAALTSEQRVALVDGMRKRARHWEGKKFGPPADFDGDAEAGEPAPERKRHSKKGKRGKRNQVFRMLRRLDLSDEQRDKLREARESLAAERPDKDAMKERFSQMKAKKEAFLKSFASDVFEPVAMHDGDKMKAFFTKKLDHKISALAAIVPVLDATQRGELADMMLKKGSMGKHFKGRHGKRDMPGAPTE